MSEGENALCDAMITIGDMNRNNTGRIASNFSINSHYSIWCTHLVIALSLPNELKLIKSRCTSCVMP